MDVDRDVRWNTRRISDTKEVLCQVGNTFTGYDVTGCLRGMRWVFHECWMGYGLSGCRH